MLKTKTKYTWEGWESSGREDWVFSVKHPCELIGTHAKLIDKELRESEKVEYCVYSPRTSSTSTPFGLRSEEASRGICVTDKRFIVSEDRHIKGVEPNLISIGFEDIQYFNIGNALILGWFSIHYCVNDSSKDMTILFSSIGKHHFEKLIRSYKKYRGKGGINECGIETYYPSSFLYNIKDNVHRNDLKTLISSGERCVLTFSCQYLWGVLKKKRWSWGKQFDVYLTNNTTLLLTNRNLLIARNGRGESASLAVDTMNISLDKIEKVELLREETSQGMIHRFKTCLIKKSGFEILDIPLMGKDKNVEASLNTVVSLLNNRKEK